MAMKDYFVTSEPWESDGKNTYVQAFLRVQTDTVYDGYRVYWAVRAWSDYGQMTYGEINFKLNGETIFYRKPEEAKMYNGGTSQTPITLASGYVTIPYDNANVSVYLGVGIYQHKINTIINNEIVTFDVVKQLAILNFTSPGDIGEAFPIKIAKYTNAGGNKTFVDIRYKIDTISGIIAQKYQKDSIDWVIPLSLFEVYPYETLGKGTLYCDTYDFDGETLLGTKSYAFTFNVVDPPKINPTVKDVDPTTLALTGNENKFIRFFSDAEFAFNDDPGKGASMRYRKLECANAVSEESSGVLENVEDATFIFTATNSRGHSATTTLTRTLVPYVKLTCNIWRIEATGDGTIKVGIGGDIWSSNFGVVRNTLRVSYRVKAGSGEFSEWKSIDYLNDDATYEVTVTLNDLDYHTTYTFEAMAEDKLMTVVSRQLPVRAVPVYDWGRDDFNVNVDFKMNHKTVLRHNNNANNVVLSSSGGFIYFRPKGTDDNTVEVKISPQGNIELSGDILIEGQSLKSLLGI